MNAEQGFLPSRKQAEGGGRHDDHVCLRLASVQVLQRFPYDLAVLGDQWLGHLKRRPSEPIAQKLNDAKRRAVCWRSARRRLVFAFASAAIVLPKSNAQHGAQRLDGQFVAAPSRQARKGNWLLLSSLNEGELADADNTTSPVYLKLLL